MWICIFVCCVYLFCVCICCLCLYFLVCVLLLCVYCIQDISYTRPLDPDWYLNFSIPEKHTFLEAVQDSIDTGLVTPRAKRGLIQVLRTLILQHTKYPTREEYNIVCRRLVEKYPKLHDGGPSGCVSSAIRGKSCQDNNAYAPSLYDYPTLSSSFTVSTDSITKFLMHRPVEEVVFAPHRFINCM